MLMLTFGPSAALFIAGACTTLVFMLALHAHQTAPDDPVDDLAFRLRSPLRWTFAHPVRAILRHV